MMLQTIKLAATASLIAIASAASATTVTFTYTNGAATEASGSFSFATGATGVLSYTDLTAFTITTQAVTYTLADVLPLTDYIHFGYDTAAVAFTVDTNSCGFAGCGFTSSLSAINSSGTFGYFFTNVPGIYREYSTGGGSSFTNLSLNAVPEPASWALMLTGFGLAGAALRRRRVLAAI